MNTIRYNKQQYLREWKAQHRTYERTQVSNFKNALDKQAAPVSDYIKRHGVTSLQSHLTVLVSAQPMQEAYLKCYTKVGTQHAEWMYNKIDKIAGQKKSSYIIETKDIPSFFSEQWRKLMTLFYHTDAGKRITDVTDTTRSRIVQLITDSQDMPISQQATYITDQLDSPDFNRTRSLVIARTESTAAANYGASLGAESNYYETAKQWLSILDRLTRPAHKAADDQVVAMDEYFVVGDEAAQYPGDLNLSAANVINCRCTVAYIPLLSASGLPILKKL